MDCPICKGKMVVKHTVHQTVRALRLYECKKCSRRFMSENILYPIETEKGEALRLQLFSMRYENRKLAALAPKKKPKPKRKVAGPPKPVKEGEVYLTYDEIFTKFMKRDVSAKFVSEYRPYPLLNYAIVIFYTDHSELVFQYDPECDQFNIVKGAMTYEDIIAGKWRKKP